MSDFPLEIEVYKGKGKRIQQVIWLKPLTFSKILMLADKYGVAPNVVIAEILDRVLMDDSVLFRKEVVEKVVKKVLCPVCLEEFDDVASFNRHVEQRHPSIASMFMREFMRG